MNAMPTLTVWLQLLGLLAAEVALTVAGAALLQRVITSAAWRRTLWQVCLFSLLILPAFELTGTARGLADWLVKRAGPQIHRAQQDVSREAPSWLTDEFRKTVADRVDRNAQLDNVGPEEVQPDFGQPQAGLPPATASPRVAQRANSPNRPAAIADDSVADSMAVLYLELVWLAGAGLVIARSCLGCFLLLVFRRRRPGVTDAALNSRVAALARTLGVGRRVQLVASARLAGPMVFGILRPVIAVPTDFAGRFTAAQQEAMLAHELAHLAARDPIWYLLANWASAILWWHPLVWWARRQLHCASEQAADEASLLVGGGPGALAECLVEIGARLRRPRSLVWMGVEGNGLRSGLGRRVERLVQLRGNSCPPPGPLRSALARILGPAALVAAVILCTAWIGPRAFTKGDSMKTMKQTWQRSLAAFALLTSLQGEGHAASALNAKPNDKTIDLVALAQERRYAQAKDDPTGTQKAPAPAGEKPSNLTGNPSGEDAAPGSMRYYQRAMMERYGLIPPGAALPAGMPAKSKERSPIASRLEGIVLNEVIFDSLPLSEVLRFLDEESRKRDPEKQGINFLINPNAATVSPGQTIDPTTGQPIPVPPPEPLDMNNVIVRFNLPLRNMRLKDVLDAIVKVADKPIEYSVEEYGVVFAAAPNSSVRASASWAPKSIEAPPLLVRTFKIDPDKLWPGMKRAFGIDSPAPAPDQFRKDSALPDASVASLRQDIASLEDTLQKLLAQDKSESPNVKEVLEPLNRLKVALRSRLSGDFADGQQVQGTLRRLLTQLGIDMDVPGKAIFYNDVTGIVMVRATFDDLEVVKAAIETLGGSASEPAASAAEGAAPSASDLMRQRYGMQRYGILPARK